MHSPVPVSWQGNSDSVGTAQTICDASPISWATASINPDTGISVINSFDFNPLFQQSRFSSFSQMLSACSSFVRPSVGYMEGCCETGVYNKLYGMDPSSIGLSNYPPLSLCPNDKTLNSICQAPGPANPKLNGGEDVVSGCNVFNYNALNNPGAAFTAFRCIPSQYYSLVLDSYVTPGAGAINYTWQDDGAGNLCQLLSMCDSNKQKWLAKYSALYAADSKGFDALFSQCGAGVAGMTGSPLISASQLNSTCQQLNAYTPSTTFSSGCCESWVYTQLFPGANLPAGYPPLSICPTNSALKTSCPSPSTFYGLPNTNSSLLQACDSVYYFALFGSAPPRYYPSTSNIANSTCIPSEVYTNLHISTNTVTWQNNSTGNLCQILNNVCNQQLVQQWQLQLQQFINVNASLYYADPAAANSAFNSSVSQCRSMVKSLNPATTYSQLDTKCVSLNAYNSSATTFKFGCCESWSNNQTGRALPSFYTPLSICPGSDMLKQSCPAPTIGITHASAGA